MVNLNMVNSKFHQFKGNLTGVSFKVYLIQAGISKFVVIQSNSRLLIKFSCNLKTLY